MTDGGIDCGIKLNGTGVAGSGIRRALRELCPETLHGSIYISAMLERFSADMIRISGSFLHICYVFVFDCLVCSSHRQ